MCDKRIVLYIYDDELSNLYEYKNDEEFDLKTIISMINGTSDKFPVSKLTTVCDEDYERLTKSHLPHDQWKRGLDEIKKNFTDDGQFLNLEK